MLAAVVGLVLACSDSSAPLPPVVALVTVDTWRADHFSAEHTPRLWQLASEGERFDNAWSPQGLTSAAHATMLTGLMPWEHGLRANNHHGYSLRADVGVLPERFEGYAKGAFVSAYPAGPDGGLARGWDVFEGPESGERPGREAVASALAWLPENQPALLWVHVYEPHGPYVGDAASDAERYAQEVRATDDLLRPLLERLVDRRARIVVAADHGEIHGEEKCGWQHERSSHDVVLRVPLFRWEPGIQPVVRTDLVGLADVPVLLEGGTVAGRQHWLAESGICESGCSGCSPEGVTGRDKVVVTTGGRLTLRAGRGTSVAGNPGEAAQALLSEIPPVPEPSPGGSGLEELGYTAP